MRLVRLLGGAALAAMLAMSAMAAEAPSPEKLALAKQMVDASRGADQMKTLLQTMFGLMRQSLNRNTPPEQKRLADIVLQKIQGRIVAATPQLIDGSVQVYAQTLTEKEMRDYLAWQLSESGQSMKRKAPLIAAETLKVVAPLIVQVTEGLKQDVIDEACKQASCTTHDREVLAKAMNQSLPDRAGDISPL